MTPTERRAGRFLRAPDHDASTAGGVAGADAGDQGNGEDGDNGDGATDKGAGTGADDGSLMGEAGKTKADGEEDGEGNESDDGKKGEGETAGPPEKYELTAPEGFELNDEIIAEADPVFRELGLDNDAANKLMPLAASFANRLQQQAVDAHQAQAANWAKEAKADPDIGKGNWPETEALVAKALDEFGAGEGSDFRKFLNDTKLGNHPAMIRMFRQIGERVAGDSDFVRSDEGAQVKRSREEVLYGTTE